MEHFNCKIRGIATRDLACGGSGVGFVKVLMGNIVRSGIPQPADNQLKRADDAVERNFFAPDIRMRVVDGDIE
jgi:hypothetical protein